MALIIGADIGKLFTYYSFVDLSGEIIVKSMVKANDSRGLNCVQAKINEIAGSPNDQVIIIMESTGCFSGRIRDFFLSHQNKVMEINPLISHSIRNVTIRKVKNDKADALALAMLYVTSTSTHKIMERLRFYHEENQNILNLRVLTRNLDKVTKARSIIKLRLISDLEQVLPYYSEIFKDCSCNMSLLFLELLVDSDNDFTKLTKSRIIKTLKLSGATRSKEYYDELYKKMKKCFEEARVIGRKVSSYYITIRSGITLLKAHNEEIKKLEQEIEKLAKEVKNIELLKSIPGVGEKLAVSIAVEIGDIGKFNHAKELVAFCGVDPSVRQSGQFTASSTKISKRGSPYLRKSLYLLALASVKKHKNGECTNKVIHEYYENKKKNKAKKVALGAVMNKLVRVIYSVLKNQKPYIMITPEEQKTIYKSMLGKAA
ncbi:MAG: IS110 family transposase [Clostridiales bacterium]|nr:IS110 family transposase [Clostridiales bacterium]